MVLPHKESIFKSFIFEFLHDGEKAFVYTKKLVQKHVLLKFGFVWKFPRPLYLKAKHRGEDTS